MTSATGRSVSACMRAYELLTGSSAGPSAALSSAISFNKYPSTTKAKNKRPAPVEDTPTPADRTTQAQTFAAVNTPGDSITYQAPAVPQQKATGPPKKKRGRPSKEEHERRVREAAERGEVYPRPKKTKTPRPSLESAAGGIPISDVMEGSSTGNTTTKLQEVALATERSDPGDSARNLSLEATASAADQVQIDTEEVSRPSIPENLTSNFPAREILLAGMREHAAMTAHLGSDKMQSSSTLKQDSAPRSEWGTHSATE